MISDLELPGLHQVAPLKQHLRLDHPVLLWHLASLLQPFFHTFLRKGYSYPYNSLAT